MAAASRASPRARRGACAGTLDPDARETSWRPSSAPATATCRSRPRPRSHPTSTTAVAAAANFAVRNLLSTRILSSASPRGDASVFPDRGRDLRHDHVFADELVGRARAASGVHQLGDVAELLGNGVRSRGRPEHGVGVACRRRGTLSISPGKSSDDVTALQLSRWPACCCSRWSARCWAMRTAPGALADDRRRPARRRDHRARAAARSRPDRPAGRARAPRPHPGRSSRLIACASVSVPSA